MKVEIDWNELRLHNNIFDIDKSRFKDTLEWVKHVDKFLEDQYGLKGKDFSFWYDVINTDKFLIFQMTYPNLIKKITSVSTKD